MDGWSWKLWLSTWHIRERLRLIRQVIFEADDDDEAATELHEKMFCTSHYYQYHMHMQKFASFLPFHLTHTPNNQQQQEFLFYTKCTRFELMQLMRDFSDIIFVLLEMLSVTYNVVGFSSLEEDCLISLFSERGCLILISISYAKPSSSGWTAVVNFWVNSIRHWLVCDRDK
jgi:hypothetical protein